MEREIVLIHPLHSLWFLPFLLYAETHYRFRYFFSLLKKDEPEIIADAPHRLEPGRQLPVLLLVKDAHLYPSTLNQVRIEVLQNHHVIHRADCLEQPTALDHQLSWRIFYLDTSAFTGWIEVDVSFALGRNGITTSYHNDNHRTSTKRPLRVFVAKEPLPRFPDLHLGDPHTHSNFTEDQVEFGSPMRAARELSRALGLSFFCVTDHSYDLDDHVDSYLTNDPQLAKWKVFQEEVESLNDEARDFAVVRGEEVTCRNENGENVHLLLFGQREFINGSGDGADKWLHTRSEHNVSDVLRLRSGDSVAYAAHAKEPVPFLQRLLLGRGIWSDLDLHHDGISGLQILNGKLDEGFRRGYRSWIHQLLGGRQLCAIAGNDAHGNFNRFRQVGIPFFAIREEDHQIFGKMRTGLFLGEQLSEHAVLESLKEGSAILTDGPVARLSAGWRDAQESGSGATARGDSLGLDLEVFSSSEFGEITSIKIIVGKVGEATERTAFRFDGHQGFDLRKQFSIRRPAISYVRVEVLTSEDNTFDQKQHFCFTNPIWISVAT